MRATKRRHEDGGRFAEYGSLEEHRTMLQDEVRTGAFKAALEAVSGGRIVMDLGCGSGVLSIFAARAGARQVVAVDGSPVAISVARKAAKASGVASNIRFFEGDVTQIAGEIDTYLSTLEKQDHDSGSETDGVVEQARQRVDVLVSEWMGFALLHEAMFPAVAFARDRWLSEGGTVIPSACNLRAAPFTYPDLVEEVTGLWLSQPYGVDFSDAAHLAWQQAASQPVLDALPSSAWAALGAVDGECGNGDGDGEPCGSAVLLARPCALWTMDCTAASAEDTLSPGTLPFSFVSDVPGGSALHGLALWFDVTLILGAQGSAAGFSTGPEAAPTHWAQVLLLIDGQAGPRGATVFPVLQAGDKFDGSLHVKVRQAGGEVDFVFRGSLPQRTLASDLNLAGTCVADDGMALGVYSFEKQLELVALKPR